MKNGGLSPVGEPAQQSYMAVFVVQVSPCVCCCCASAPALAQHASVPRRLCVCAWMQGSGTPGAALAMPQFSGFTVAHGSIPDTAATRARWQGVGGIGGVQGHGGPAQQSYMAAVVAQVSPCVYYLPFLDCKGCAPESTLAQCVSAPAIGSGCLTDQFVSPTCAGVSGWCHYLSDCQILLVMRVYPGWIGCIL